MKLFQIISHWNYSGTYRHMVILNDSDELKMRIQLQSEIDSHKYEYHEIKELDINSVNDITVLRGLSLLDLKKLIDNM